MPAKPKDAEPAEYEVLSVSCLPSEAELVRRAVKKGKFRSISALFRAGLHRLDEDGLLR